MKFKNKSVIITGAARGIGLACAEAFLSEGAKVALLDLAFPDTVKSNENIVQLVCDVTSKEEVKQAMYSVYEKFESLDYLINNAGIQRYGTVTDTSEEEWDEIIAVNLKSQFLCSKYAIPYMEEGNNGVVVNVASVQSYVSQHNVAAYTTSKSAILGLTRSIAIDYAPKIRCVAVCPGTIDTPMLREAIELSPDPKSVMQECVDMHLLKRIGTPKEVAQLILFLCEDKAAFITGQAIRIDGGLGIAIEGSKRD